MAKKAKAKAKPKKFDKSKLRASDDVVIEKVDCSEEWPEMGDIYVRSMSARGRDTYEMECFAASKRAKESGVGSYMDNHRALLVVCTACHKNGSPIFDAHDLEWLGNKNAKSLDKIVDAGQKLAGISSKDLDDMEKSLEADQS